MTPSGAMCAVHVTEAAVLTCERCGNFMCVRCAGGGTSRKCPSCFDATSRFPYGPEATFDTLWSHTQAAWRRELVMLTVATLVWLAITIAGTTIAGVIATVVNAIVGKGMSVGYFAVSTIINQIISTLIGAVIQAFALTGLYRVMLDVLLGRTVDLGRMFTHMFLLPRMVALQVIMAVLFTLPMLAIFAGTMVGSMSSSGVAFDSLTSAEIARLMPRFLGSFVLSFLVISVLAIIVMPISMYAVPELMVGDCGPFEAITRAWKLGSGQRIRMFGYGFVGGIVMLLGMLACLVGVLPALPLIYMLLLSLFLALRNGSGLPAPKFD